MVSPLAPQLAVAGVVTSGDYEKWSLQVITKILVGVAIAVIAAGLAATTRADPNPFGNLSCSCQSPPDVGPVGPGQIIQRIRDGLADPLAAQRQSTQ